MGYTHYLNEQINISDWDWKILKQYTRSLFMSSLETDTPLGNVSGDEYSFPVIDDTYIGFNGIGDAGYETAGINKSPMEDTLMFCKTANKDYDKYVVAFYHIIHTLNFAVFTSDGEPDELAEGIALGNSIMGVDNK